jgi:hypothetical protein
MIQISDTGGCEMRVVKNGVIEYYSYSDIKSVSPYKNSDGQFIIIFNFINESRDSTLRIPLALITNQPSWTTINAAINDIQLWMGACNSTAGLATEATLLQVLSAVDNMRDYEVRLVTDSASPNPVTWLEVRYWDAQSGALGAPQYYLPGSTTPGSPVLPISYINDQSLLTQILAELQGTLDVNVTNTVNVAGTVSLSPATLFDLNTVTVVNSTLTNAVNIQDGGNSITVDGGAGFLRNTGILRPTGSGNVNTAAATFYSVSVANVGSANGSVLGGTGNIKPGEVLNFSADAINNYFGSFDYNATGTEFIIIYVS